MGNGWHESLCVVGLNVFDQGVLIGLENLLRWLPNDSTKQFYWPWFIFLFTN